ncbi:MAG: OmcA/MtrC family decaheme c-type cytochrome [Thermoanaerobaculia bacterium]
MAKSPGKAPIQAAVGVGLFFCLLAPAIASAGGEHRAVPTGGGIGLEPASSHVIYPEGAKEAYLSSDQLNYIRPGLKIKVNSVTIPADRRPVVDFTITDDLNQPLDRLGQITPGAISVSFILAWWNPDLRQYTAYTTRTVTSPITNVTAVQAGTDSGGVFTDLELGHAKYVFKTVLPTGFDITRTHTLGLYSTRATLAIMGKNYYANVEFDFRPDAAAVTSTWLAMNDAKSCASCHDPLSAHGGSRRDVKLCVLCHTPQTTDPDTGNTVDFKVMVHKIHRGDNLPSVKAGTPYQIIGFGQSVVDFSTVAYPQDIRNCATCHEATAPEAPIWYTRPTRASCGSCHDNVNWVTGANHAAGPQPDDVTCANCHAPQGDHEWDASIKGAHTIPVKSTQLTGIKMTIVSVTNGAAGQKPTIVFTLKNNAGATIDPTTFAGSIAFTLGGPIKDSKGHAVTDYASYVRSTAKAATTAFVGTFANGQGTHTSTVAIPANAAGTWTATSDVRRAVALNPAPRTPAEKTVNEAAFNPIFRFVVTDTQPVARRTVVTMDKCNKCHETLALHGGQRFNVDECVICHNPNESDLARRPAAELPAESVSFKRMIHRIHTGEKLTQDMTIYGFGGTPLNFNEVRYPGDRRNCIACHSTGSANLPLPAGTIDTITLRDYFTPQGPGTAACLGCHDNRDAAAHAAINTAIFGEACASCHGANSEWSVDKVHAR